MRDSGVAGYLQFNFSNVGLHPKDVNNMVSRIRVSCYIVDMPQGV